MEEIVDQRAQTDKLLEKGKEYSEKKTIALKLKDAALDPDNTF